MYTSLKLTPTAHPAYLDLLKSREWHTYWDRILHLGLQNNQKEVRSPIRMDGKKSFLLDGITPLT